MDAETAHTEEDGSVAEKESQQVRQRGNGHADPSNGQCLADPLWDGDSHMSERLAP